MSRLIVKNLPGQITKEKLHQIFSEKGVVTDVQLKYTKDGVFRKFAFIGFQKPEYAEAAKTALNKSFINMSRIQVETCAELGDPQKPRPWSKYAPENAVDKKRKKEPEEKPEVKKPKKAQKEQIKDPKIKEMLKSHENDELFTEFMKVNVPGLELGTKNEEGEKMEDQSDEENDVETKEEEDNDKNDVINTLANQDISDSEYIKLKTGQDVKLETESKEDKESLKKNGKKVINIELYTIKIKGVPLRVKKSQIREFLKPLKPFTIRRALKIKGIAYVGFKTEKEMKQALQKNRSFLSGRRLYVTAVRKKNLIYDKELETKWKRENERLEGLENVAESGRIFIRNLPYTATEEELQELFVKYGPISEFIFPIDSFTRKPKGFAIVTFLLPEHACTAFTELDGTIFSGRMLHLLPGMPNNERLNEDTGGESFKQKKLKKEQAKINSTVNWNTFFVGENALAEVVAATYNTTKEHVLDDKQGGAAVRLALGETQLISKMKEFLTENDVCLESFENMSVTNRSKTVILVKNLPFGTTSDEIREKFCKFGLLRRVVLPPSGVAALVEFVEPSEAKIAFRRISYSKFKHVPLYLEWAPDKVFLKDAKPSGQRGAPSTAETVSDNASNVVQEQSSQPETTKEETEPIAENFIPEEGTVIFVKNLNFATDEGSLRNHFETCGRIISVTIAKKKDPKQPGKTLSMGYGFVSYGCKESADNALKKLQFTNLDNHRIELKRSNRTVASSEPMVRKTSKSNQKPSPKILVRNVPFQATKRELCDLFKVFGEIKAIRLPKKMVGTGSHRGFCFVEYNTVQEAKQAFAALSESTHIYGRRLVLEWAAIDEDVETLREKTAHQFKAGSGTQKKKINMDEIQNDK
ncbi:hypothetical protein RUM44_008375 [Polyplax serrata]|uniref:RRM domain-containing protein n=1 Tax=Polyplax serrata TaxID=468196 RepID=A0ABR1BC99_POLSC